ncbi:aminopeptidase N-like [Nylanderia fulva]|uniref:aminopeptidase N-like n=1 Tax=Nylanderia fulva TaxID=613905 RepID=UPI0010FB94C5|nr:aminopeptidase N-like [Nylanderia fulva]
MMDLFVVQKQHESLHLNYYFNGEALENKCSKSTRTNSSPYYNKAPFFLRMLQYLITHDVFREGVHKYIKRHASDSTTVPNNLWAAMQDALHENSQNEYKENIHNLTYLMSSWIKQKHYPVVTIKRHVDDTVSMQLESYIPTDMRDTLMIPVTFTSQSHPNFNHTSYKNVKWLSSVLHNWPIVKFPLYFEENGWIIANLKQANYYRVNYDSENWDKIANYLNSSNYTEIHVLNRAQIIDDSFHLAIQGLQDYSLFWKISSYLSRETDYIAWYPMFKALEYISSIFPFENEKRVQDIKDFLNNIFDGLFTKIEYLSNDTDNEFTKYLKQEARRWACTLNHNECLIQAYNKMGQYADKSRTHMNPWEREWTFCQGFKSVDIYTLKQASYIMLHDFGGQAMMFMSCVRKIPINNEFFEIVNLLRYDRAKMTDKIFLFYSVIAKHARDPKTLDFILSEFYNIKPSQINTEAALIVIINNIYSDEESRKVISFLIQDDNINRCLKNIIRFKIKLRASQIKTQKNYFLRLKFAENIIYNNNIHHNNKT